MTEALEQRFLLDWREEAAGTPGLVLGENGLVYLVGLDARRTLVPTVETPFGGAVSAYDFGAVGDGTVDDAPAIQRALDSFPERGGIVDLGCGTFKGMAPLVLGNGSILRGMGGSLLTQQTASGLPAGTLRYHPQTILDFSQAACGAIMTDPYATYRCQWPQVRNMLIRGPGRLSGQTAIHLAPGQYANPNYRKVGGAIIDSVFMTDFTTGIDFDTSDGTMVNECSISQVVDCLLDGSSEPTVQANDFWDFTGSLWKVSNVANCFNAWFGPNNQIEPDQLGSVGLDWKGVQAGFVFQNTGQQFQELGTAVILRDGCSGITIIGNDFNVLTSGIVFSGAVKNVTLSGNHVRGTGSSLVTGFDLRTSDAVGHITAVGNIAEGAFANSALWDAGKSAVYLAGNDFPTVQGGASLVTVAGAVSILQGTGSPQGVVTAGPGSLYMRRDGGAGATFYVKETGSGSTGWVAK